MYVLFLAVFDFFFFVGEFVYFDGPLSVKFYNGSSLSPLSFVKKYLCLVLFTNR